MPQGKKSMDTRASENVELVLVCSDCGEQFEQRSLDRAELEARAVTELPNREAMSLVNANVAAPINLALAANVLSDGSTATAVAQQYAPIKQGM